MTKGFKYSLLTLLLFVSWIPARPKGRPPLHYRYVTGAELVFCHGSDVETRHYRKPEKLSSLLTYLRLTRPRPGAKIESLPESDHRYRITLRFSDNTQCVCRLYGYNLLSRNGGRWEVVLPVHAQLIYPLFYYLPSDR